MVLKSKQSSPLPGIRWPPIATLNEEIRVDAPNPLQVSSYHGTGFSDSICWSKRRAKIGAQKHFDV
jgi:hypothetical protein